MTIKRLTKLLDEMFIRYEMDTKVREIRKTRFRSQDYDAGPCLYQVFTDMPEFDGPLLLIFVPLSEIEYYLNAGYVPSLELDRYNRFNDEICFHKVRDVRV